MGDVEGPCPQGEVERATAPVPITAEPNKDAAQQAYTGTITYIAVPGSWERRAYPSRPLSSFTPPELKPGEIAYITKGTFVGCGGTARLERLPSGDVVKTPLSHLDLRFSEASCKDMRTEARIYDIIGLHPRVPRIVAWDPQTCCLTMEYLENGTLKEYITTKPEGVTSQLRQRWARQASEGMSILHAADVIHCDISPRNFLLDGNLDLKIADFGGSSLSGSMPSAAAGTRFRWPVEDWNALPTFGDDVFGLGSLVYFIMTGVYPYGDVASDEVEKLYGAHTYPDVTQLGCGDIIARCWGREVSAAEVHAYFEALGRDYADTSSPVWQNALDTTLSAETTTNCISKQATTAKDGVGSSNSALEASGLLRRSGLQRYCTVQYSTDVPPPLRTVLKREHTTPSINAEWETTSGAVDPQPNVHTARHRLTPPDAAIGSSH
ncbi:hypothetical protein V500_08936 [Pseudogymnoascus sp. VKM F-4518 (FW-2643)]|nr:hypothetical protein V500_08936 [Pseudogymnoascus sp. VKM F-4518 (FW-2643)]